MVHVAEMDVTKAECVRDGTKLFVGQKMMLTRPSGVPDSVCYLHLREKDGCCCEKSQVGRVLALKNFYEMVSSVSKRKMMEKLYSLCPSVRERVDALEKLINNN